MYGYRGSTRTKPGHRDFTRQETTVVGGQGV